ncbi:response regulator transcription factor [Salisediminibacterium halotolerans]|uniref:Two-component system, NarL family, response regulator DegU n=1 Tax=Salisediminibacterium halotolerans TaxID=517425 RepID=A0A1H9TS54_9BACI|nr:LuxR C-terminal-related transcriptional regulator [Salisediminibacterium haloalkalitolerans]SER99956.1 two-component system, NarL family, response regulator DegU [Salisediminibacterium haloalkalitolerans]
MPTFEKTQDSVANEKVLFIDREHTLTRDNHSALVNNLHDQEVIVDKEPMDDLESITYIFYFIREDRYETMKWLEAELSVPAPGHVKKMIITDGTPSRNLFPYLNYELHGIVSLTKFIDETKAILQTLDKYNIYLEQSVHKAFVEEIHARKMRDRPINKLQIRKPDVEHLLTANEIRVLQHILDGFNNRQIAEELYLAPSTVSTVISHLLKKLDANDRTDAMVRVIRKGWVDALR